MKILASKILGASQPNGSNNFEMSDIIDLLVTGAELIEGRLIEYWNVSSFWFQNGQARDYQGTRAKKIFKSRKISIETIQLREDKHNSSFNIISTYYIDSRSRKFKNLIFYSSGLWKREKRKREKIQERQHSKGTQRIAGADTPQKQQIASLLQCRVFAVSQYRRGAAGICEQPSCDWCNLNGAATSHRRRRVAISGGVTSASASNSPFLRRSFAR
ncbi:hypothetical protein ACJJTC_013641 [Scirpophaga incertulas]